MSGTLYLTSKEKLNIHFGWESMKKQIDFLGLCIFQKIHKHESRPLVRKCLPKWDSQKIHMTRSKGGYTPYPNLGLKFLNSFFP